jgi:hypothetical protein
MLWIAATISPRIGSQEASKQDMVTGKRLASNVSHPVLDEHGYAVAALTVPYIRRIGDNATTAMVRQTLKRASSQHSQEIGGISRERQKVDT